MKRHVLLALSLMLTLITTPANAGWFDNNDQKEKEKLQVEVKEQRQSTETWQLVAGGFAVLTSIAFTIGTVLGSRTRRQHEQRNGTQQ